MNCSSSSSACLLIVAPAFLLLTSCASVQGRREPASAHSLNWAGGVECRVSDYRPALQRGLRHEAFFALSLVRDGQETPVWSARRDDERLRHGVSYLWGELLEQLAAAVEEKKCDRLSIVQVAQGAKDQNPYKPKNKRGSLSWGTDTCYVADFTHLIEKGLKTEFYYYIQPFNHNGGSVVETYGTEEFSSAYHAFSRMVNDLRRFSESCDRLAKFHPRSEKDELRN